MTDNKPVSVWEKEQVIGEISEVGWRPKRGLSYEDWEEAMHSFFQVQRSLNWIIGDGLNFGEGKFGETYAQVAEVTGWDYQRLADAKWVAGAVPYEIRRPELSWTHHRYVADMDVDSQIRWLQLAVDNDWRTADLSAALSGKLLSDGSEIVLPIKARPKRKLLSEIFVMYETGAENDSVSEWVGRLSREEKEAVLEIRDLSEGLSSFCNEIARRLNGRV